VVVAIGHEIAGAGSDHHRRWHLGELGNDNRPCVERTRSFDSVGTYLSKYFAKPVHGPEWEAFGKAWGEVRRCNRGNFVLLQEHAGAAAAVVPYQRAIRRHRFSQHRVRCVLIASVREGPGVTAHRAISMEKLRGVYCAASEGVRKSGFWQSLFPFWRCDIWADLSIPAVRKAFRARLAEFSREFSGTLKIRLKCIKPRRFSAPVERTVNGVVQSVRVERPMRRSFMRSSEAVRLWETCNANVVKDIEWFADRRMKAGESPLVGLRALQKFNAA
jgi:hypothetical protein